MLNRKPIWLALAWMMSTPLFAQDLSEKSFALDNVVVTGEKVVRSLDATASSVSVFNAKNIHQSSGKNSVKEVIAQSANVLSDSSVGAPIIRGQDTQGPNYGAGAFFGGTVPRVGINIDGRVGGYNELYFGSHGVWDTEQIELYRGPQTTSQGANSIAGAVVVKTKDPTFKPVLLAELFAASRNKLGLGFVASGAIVENELAARLAMDYVKRDTFVRFVNPKFDPGEAKKGLLHANIRAKLLYLPQNLPELEAKLTISHSRSEGPQQEYVYLPVKDKSNNDDSIVSWPINSTAFIGDLRYDFGENSYLINQLQVSNAHLKRVIRPANTGSADISVRDFSNETRWHFANSLRNVKGFIGLYWRDTRSDESLNIRGITHFDDRKKQWGLFGELSYQPHPLWTLTGGLRYQYDDIDRHGHSVMVKGVPLNYRETFHELLPKMTVSYQAKPQWILGASIAKGYNPGGVALSFIHKKFIKFKPETVWNYELFTRTHLFNNRLYLSGNLFYSDFKNAQRNVLGHIPDAPLLVESLSLNAESAKSYGMEWVADWAINRQLKLNASLGLLHTKIGQFNHTQVDYTGKSFNKSPEYTFQLGFDWQLHPRWLLSGQWRRVGSYYSDDENKPEYHINAYDTVNTRLSYTPSKHFEIFSYINNLLDDQSATWIRDPARKGLKKMAHMQEPREIGVGVRAQW